MRVRLIKKKTIDLFASKHARSRTSLEMWYNSIKYADWNDTKDILQTFGSADLQGYVFKRVVFNIAGNKYRMICKYHVGITRVHLAIKWIGTHANYTELCKKNGQYTINSF